METTGISNQNQIDVEHAHFITKVYGLMALGLAISGLISMGLDFNSHLVISTLSIQFGFWVMFALQIGVVVLLTTMIHKFSASLARIAFLVYSIITGFVFYCLFFAIFFASITPVFFIIAATFGIMSLIGFFSKTDLTNLSRILLMFVLGIIVATATKYYMNFSNIILLASYFGVALFSGLVLLNKKKIREFNIIGDEGTDEDKKEAIMGALCLYIVF